ncbi:DNA adenine methylase [Devosia sp.]|uniref:DNA adenine methylase n=1 Tax=Devosia sp. TaxID=1871048 RepID=UPI002F01A203
MDPFLKWAGGKRWLTAGSRFPVPVRYNRYIEPFVGSGAVFFHLLPQAALLGDANGDLIELYTAMRDSPSQLYARMVVHQALHNREHYYAVRSCVPADRMDRAARLLYLNRTCWNGLYRVNRRGEFNVPIGTKVAVLLDGERFQDYADALKGTELYAGDFEAVVDRAENGDFLFVDPPYTVKHNENGFVKYNEQLFSWEDQCRLREALLRAKSRGVTIAMTNADHLSIRELYGEEMSYRSIERHSILAASSARRGRTTEALYTVGIP